MADQEHSNFPLKHIGEKNNPLSMLSHNKNKANARSTHHEAEREITKNRAEKTAGTTKYPIITAADEEEVKIADYKPDAEKIHEQ
eukprot:538576-Ditylum_brightwellii.AAC.1